VFALLRGSGCPAPRAAVLEPLYSCSSTRAVVLVQQYSSRCSSAAIWTRSWCAGCWLALQSRFGKARNERSLYFGPVESLDLFRLPSDFENELIAVEQSGLILNIGRFQGATDLLVCGVS
jgi:hypothetical protein